MRMVSSALPVTSVGPHSAAERTAPVCAAYAKVAERESKLSDGSVDIDRLATLPSYPATHKFIAGSAAEPGGCAGGAAFTIAVIGVL